MENTNKQNDGERTVDTNLAENADSGIERNSEMHDSTIGNRDTRTQGAEQVYSRFGRERSNNEGQETKEEPRGLAKGYNFENAREDWDPKETRPQPAEFYKFTNETLKRQGHL